METKRAMTCPAFQAKTLDAPEEQISIEGIEGEVRIAFFRRNNLGETLVFAAARRCRCRSANIPQRPRSITR